MMRVIGFGLQIGRFFYKNMIFSMEDGLRVIEHNAAIIHQNRFLAAPQRRSPLFKIEDFTHTTPPRRKGKIVVYDQKEMVAHPMQSKMDFPSAPCSLHLSSLLQSVPSAAKKIILGDINFSCQSKLDFIERFGHEQLLWILLATAKK
jgi:hypothetical protein